jgi:hypothetical protein
VRRDVQRASVALALGVGDLVCMAVSEGQFRPRVGGLGERRRRGKFVSRMILCSAKVVPLANGIRRCYTATSQL